MKYVGNIQSGIDLISSIQYLFTWIITNSPLFPVKAAYGLCCWVRAMEAYDRVAKVVAPKKAKLAEAEAEFSELMVRG